MRFEHGTVRSHSQVPRWLDLNAVRVESSGAPYDADALHRLADELQADRPHRRLEILDPSLAGAVTPGLIERGWEHDGNLLLGWDGGAPPVCDVLAEEVHPEAVVRLRRRWVTEWAPDDELVEQVLAADRIVARHSPTRAFAVWEVGLPAAFGILVEHGGEAMLTELYTAPEARGRGYGVAVIAAVLHAALGGGASDVFIPTDAGGRARDLYARLGFRELAVMARFARWP